MTTDSTLPTIADEAVRLLDALSARRASPPPGPRPPRREQAPPSDTERTPRPEAGTAADTGSESTAPGEHPPTCTWCPLCRGVEAMRQADPEAMDRLTDAVNALATAMGELADAVKGRVPGGEAAPQARTTTYDIPVVDEED